jgi:hypothetical protein
MAHKLKPQVQTAVGVPVTVLLMTTPGRWETTMAGSELSSRFLFRSGKGLPARSLFPEAGKARSGSLLVSNAWKVRDVFLRLDSENDFLAFLNDLGCFLSVPHGRESEWDFVSFWFVLRKRGTTSFDTRIAI